MRAQEPPHTDGTSGKLMTFRRGRDLGRRREVAVELPEFLIVMLERRVVESNDGASADERVTLSHLVEYQVAEMLSIRDVAENRDGAAGIQRGGAGLASGRARGMRDAGGLTFHGDRATPQWSSTPSLAWCRARAGVMMMDDNRSASG